ncbi:MAG TPA: hypothetical protein VHK67_01725 [Rhabdochlamydiaceae bacterium]|jgi:hypothetical protein|nr:hypothetical protein [Rhabdochlamydiaceae bacterium]
MSIKGVPEFPLPKPDLKRKAKEVETEGKRRKTSEDNPSGVITEGCFKGLPSPFQITGAKNLMPYIGCNERGQETTLAALTPSTVSAENRVHLGFSVWFNFDLMAVSKPSYGIICDVDDNVMDIYKGIAGALEKSSNRGEFVTYFRQFLEASSEHLYALPPEEMSKLFDIDAELIRPGSWLSSEASFQVIKNLATKSRLLFLNVNITDKQAFIQLKTWLDTNHLELDILYASNIIDWLKDELSQQSYLLNLKMVSTSNTRFIQASTPTPRKSRTRQPKQEPVQSITKGVDTMTLPGH